VRIHKLKMNLNYWQTGKKSSTRRDRCSLNQSKWLRQLKLSNVALTMGSEKGKYTTRLSTTTLQKTLKWQRSTATWCAVKSLGGLCRVLSLLSCSLMRELNFNTVKTRMLQLMDWLLYARKTNPKFKPSSAKTPWCLCTTMCTWLKEAKSRSWKWNY
jgi:hypothetical protein